MSATQLPVDYYDRLVQGALAPGGSSTVETRDRSHVIRITTSEQQQQQRQTEVVVRVADILSLFSRADSSSAAGPPVHFIAAFLALIDFNRRKSSFVDNLEELTANCDDLKLTMRYRDPQFDPVRAGRIFQDEYFVGDRNGTTTTAAAPKTARGITSMAVVGPIRSVESEMIAMMGSAAGHVGRTAIPNISPSSTSADLEDRVQYPYFARTIPTNRVDALALGLFLESIGVKRLAALHVNDGYGRAYALSLQEAARVRNIQLVVVSYTDGAPESVEKGIASLGAANCVYHLLISSPGRKNWEPVVYALLEASLIGVADKTWFLTDSLRAEELDLVDPRLVRALNRTAALRLTTPKEQATTMDDRISLFMENDALLEHFISKQENGPLADIGNATHFRSKFKDVIFTNEQGLMAYDAVMALGIAACRTPQEFFTGPELYESLKGVRFEGSSGRISFDPVTASRPFASITILNILVDPNGTKTTGVESVVVDVEAGRVEILNPLVFADGSTTPPLSLEPVAEDMNLLGNGERAACFAIAGVAMFCAAGCAIWTAVNRNESNVKASQPTFLFVLALGSFIVGSSILPATFQEPMPAWILDSGCMLTVWLASIGFSTGFSALYARTLRIHRVFQESRRGRRIQIRVRHVLVPVIVLLALNVVLLAMFTIVSPLAWRRIPTNTDSYGRTTSSIGLCTNSSDPPQIIFLSLTVGVNFAALCLSNWMTYRARNLPSQFNDNPYIGMTNMVLLECVVIGAPILFVTSSDPASFTMVLSVLLAMISATILLSAVLPFVLKPRACACPRNGALVRFLSGEMFNPKKARCDARHFPSCQVDFQTFGTSKVHVSGLSHTGSVTQH